MFPGLALSTCAILPLFVCEFSVLLVAAWVLRPIGRLAASDGWYDLTVTCAAEAGALWRYAGKVETGRQGRTDPAIGAMRP